MPKQEQITQGEARRIHNEAVDKQARDVGKTAVREELLEDIDYILDEIDAVLVENAEEFVAAYQQKGGQ